jgi:hypothetical protein
MKIIERKTVPKSRYGRVVFNNHNLEPHEEATVFCLSSFGFDVETIIPSNIPKSKNPDLLMLGTVWEMKGPRTANESTIRTKFRKARKQADGKAIFDLRNTSNDTAEIKKYILKLFSEIREMRRIMIIENDQKLLDIIK